MPRFEGEPIETGGRFGGVPLEPVIPRRKPGVLGLPDPEQIARTKPLVTLREGGQSFERMITITEQGLNEGRPSNIPTIWAGVQLSDDEAVGRAIKSRMQFPSYGTVDEAVQAAQKRSKALGKAAGMTGGRFGGIPLDRADQSLTRSALHGVVQGAAGGVAGFPEAVAIGRQAAARGLLEQYDKIDRGGMPDPNYRMPGGPAMYYLISDAETRERLQDEQRAAIQPIAEEPAYQLGQRIRKGTAEAFPIPKEHEERFAVQFGRGVGSTGTFLLSGIAGKVLRLPALAVAAGTGAVVNAAETFREAIDSGASFETAYQAAKMSGVVGTSEALPIARLLDRYDKASGGQIRRIFINAAKGGIEEGTQEFLQSVVQNLIAEGLYDPEREMFTGTGEAGSVGFSVGALFNALAGMLGVRVRGGGKAVTGAEAVPEPVAPPPSLEDIEERTARTGEPAPPLPEPETQPPLAPTATAAAPGLETATTAQSTQARREVITPERVLEVRGEPRFQGEPVGPRFQGHAIREPEAAPTGPGRGAERGALFERQPRSAEAAPAVRKRPIRRKPLTLAEFVSKMGGIRDETGELRAMDAHRWHLEKPFRSRIVRDDGLSPAEMAELATEANHLPKNEIGSGAATNAELYEALDRDLRGQTVYAQEDLGAVEEARAGGEAESQRDQMRDVADELGFPPEVIDRMSEPELSEAIAYEIEARSTPETRDADAETLHTEAVRLLEEARDAFAENEWLKIEPQIAGPYGPLPETAFLARQEASRQEIAARTAREGAGRPERAGGGAAAAGEGARAELIPGVPRTVFRGSGRTEKGEVYAGPAEPVLGPGRYYAFTEEAAKEFGPEIEQIEFTPENPLVIRSDQEWRALTKEAGWKFPNPFGQEEAQVRQDIGRLQEIIRGRGHDAVVVTWDDTTQTDTDRFGNVIKNLRNVFGQPQAFLFEEARPARAPATELTEQGVQTVIPGAEQISDRVLAERKMEQPLQPKAGQKPADEGLFDVAGRGQTELFTFPGPLSALQQQWGKIADRALDYIADLNWIQKTTKGYPIRDPYMAALGQQGQQRYLAMRREAMGRAKRAEDLADHLGKIFENTTDVEARAIFEYLTTAGANPRMIPARPVLIRQRGRMFKKKAVSLRNAAVAAKSTIKKLGQNMVRRGVLSQESFDRHADLYLPRVYLKFLLERDAASGAAGLKIGGQGYLKQRIEDLPAEYRDLYLGEIKDPAFLVRRALSVPAWDLAMDDFLHDIAENAEWVLPEGFIEWKPPGLRGTRKVTPYWLKAEAQALRDRSWRVGDEAQAEAMRGLGEEMDALGEQGLGQFGQGGQYRDIVKDYEQLPDSPRYGDMRGAYVRKDIWNDIMGAHQMLVGEKTSLDKLGEVSRVFTAFWKMSKVPLNVPTVARNFGSNMILMHLAGDVRNPPLRMIQALWQIRHNGQYYRAALRQGVTASTFKHQELQDATRDVLRIRGETTGGFLGWSYKVGSKVAGRFEKAADFYQFLEVWSKTAVIIDQMRRGATEEQAAAKAQEALFDYSAVPNVLRQLRRHPFGTPFITFFYKAAPAILRGAARHPGRMFMYYAIPYLLGEAIIKALQNVDDDAIEALLKALPQWMEDKGSLLIWPFQDEKGRWQVFDLSYWLPWGAHEQAARAMREIATGDFREGGSELFKDFGVFGGPVPQVMVAMKTGKDTFTGYSIFEPTDPPRVKAIKLLNYSWRLAAPTWLTDIGFTGHMYRTLANKPNYRGDPPLTALQASLRLVGVNIYPVNPEDTRNRNIQRFRREIIKINDALRRVGRDQSLSKEEKELRREEYLEIRKFLVERRDQYDKDSRVHPRLRVGVQADQN